MRRVVVTGLGLVTPLGCGIRVNWDRLVNGESGIRAIQSFDVSDLPAKIAGMVPIGETAEGNFNADDWVSAKERRRMETFIVYALAAAQQAIEDAGWETEDEEEQNRTGVLIGSGIGGINEIARNAIMLEEGKLRKISPFFIPSALINLASGHVSIKYGYRGPNHSVVTACATGAHALGDAARLIMFDDADVMIAGGTEAALGRLSLAGFCAARALSTKFNDTPERASRPWDVDRDGFVMSEGAGVVVLEEYEHARKRGAPIYAEVAGYGLSGDAHHITAPSETGAGARACMSMALRNASMLPDEVDYINAHGTSTPLGDEIEAGAVKSVFGEAANRLSMSSTKSSVGHLLGAAGAVEAIYAIKSIGTGIVPPTLNLDTPDEGCDLDLVPYEAKERPVRAAMSNSFGFGGTNASLVFKSVN